MGVLFVIAGGILVVLAVLVGINQIGSLSGSTRDTTATLELCNKASLLAESAVDEGAYAALTFDLNNPAAPADGLYLRLRQYVPPADPNQAPTTQAPVFEGATPFIIQATCAPQLTYDAIKADTSLTLRWSDPASNPVYYGPLDWHPIMVTQNSQSLTLVPESNESVGILGFAHTACIKGTGFFKDIDQSVMFSRPYKCILMGPPWPFYQHSLFVIEFYGEGQRPSQDYRDQMTFDLYPATSSSTTPTVWRAKKAGPLKSAFGEFYRRAAWFKGLVKKTNETLQGLGQPPVTIDTSWLQVNQADGYPVVFDADASGNGRLDPLKSDDPDVVELNKQTTKESGGVSYAICDAGVDLEQLNTANASKYVDLIKSLGEAFKKVGAKINVRSVTPEENAKYYAVPAGSTTPSAYTALSAQAWYARATRIFVGPSDLRRIQTPDSSQFELNGIYYFRGPGPYVLDKPYVGTGILIFEDNVSVRGFVPSSSKGHAVVVAVPQPTRSDTISISVLGEVTADLLAPYGTVNSGSMAIPTQSINGSVFVRYLPDADSSSSVNFFGSQSASIPMFPSINRGSKSDYYYEPYKSGSTGYSNDYAKHMQVFLDPGYVKKLYWTKRDRH